MRQVVFRGLERTSYDYLVTGRKVSDAVMLSVLREKEVIEVEVDSPLCEGAKLLHSLPLHCSCRCKHRKEEPP